MALPERGFTKQKRALSAPTTAGLGNLQERTAKPQISPLRYAPVEMTKGRVVVALSSDHGTRTAAVV
jgi:hypothetical protein